MIRSCLHIGNLKYYLRLDDGSRMSWEVYVRFWEGLRGQFPRSTHFVATFQYKEDAARFLEAVRERFAEFGLELEPDKTRLLEFGRFAEQSRKKRGEGKPETFDFLGFTHYCSKSKKTGKFRMKRKTAKKKFRQKAQAMNLWLKHNRHLRLKDLISLINMKLRGHYQYYGVTDNSVSLGRFHDLTRSMLFKWLNRRSQKRSYRWDEFSDLLTVFPLAQPRIYFCVHSW